MSGLKIKLNSETLKHINLFQTITKASVKDCVINLDKLLFIVNKGQAGLAIGRNGSNIKNLQRLMKKKIEILEFNDDLQVFLSNVLRPVKVLKLEPVNRTDNKRVMKMLVETDGRINPKVYVKGKIKKVRPLLKKYFNVDDIQI